MTARPLAFPLIALALVMAGCDGGGRPPTAVFPPSGDVAAMASNLPSGEDAIAERLHDRDHRHWPRRRVIAEARQALEAVFSGEQIYYQKFGTFTDAADTADLRVKMGV